jgi:hypothetical protein
MCCEEGEEWNFAYVLPQRSGEPIRLVVPTSLQMGWVESPPYFFVASETAQDIAMDYSNTKLGSLPTHKFTHYTRGDADAIQLPPKAMQRGKALRYSIEVYVDNFMSIVIPTSQEQLDFVANAIMQGIHDVFPANIVNSNDPISKKKLTKGEGQYSTFKTLLGFDFDGNQKTMWRKEEKQAKLLTTLKGWICSGDNKQGVPFKDFESVTAKLRHAFLVLQGSKGLLSPCNRLLHKQPTNVYFHWNPPLFSAIKDMRTLLCESTTRPMRCKALVAGGPDYVGVCNASSFGAGGIIIGKLSECPSTVFRLQGPPDVIDSVVLDKNRCGKITNLDWEMAGLLLLWLMIEHVCSLLTKKRVALFSDHSPTNSRSMCQPTSKIAMPMISILRIVPFKLEDWRRLPVAAKNIGTVGRPIRGLWEWTHIFRMQASQCKCGHSQASWHASAQDTMVKESKSKLHSQ